MREKEELKLYSILKEEKDREQPTRKHEHER